LVLESLHRTQFPPGRRWRREYRGGTQFNARHATIGLSMGANEAAPTFPARASYSSASPRRSEQSPSAYEVATELIGKSEALIVRSFANDLLNVRMEKF
jgi:hypothetical protein